MKYLKAIFAKKAWHKIIPSISMIVSITILLTCVSYSWIRREWSPRIEQQGITIATGNTLTFIFDSEDDGGIKQSIIELLDEPNFKLKSVSNLTGRSEDFFCLEADPEKTGIQYYKLWNIRSRTQSSDNMRIGAEYGYVDVSFKVQAPNNDGYKRYIYIDTESYLSIAEGGDENVIKPIRISVTLSDVGSDDKGITYIFGSEEKTHTAINNERETEENGFALHGQRRYSDELDENGHPIPLQNVELNSSEKYSVTKDGATMYTLDKFKGDINDIENTTLFELENGHEKIITVRIWAEGEDEHCTSAISGKDFNLLLKFSALIVK